MYTKQGGKVFHYDVEVKGANPKTFVALNWTWGKDDKKVFAGARLRRVKDPCSFEALNECYGRDKFRIYLPHKDLPKADRNSFKVLDAGTAPPGFDLGFHGIDYPAGYAKDRAAVYYLNVTVKGGDPKSFQSLRGRFGVDSKDAYYEGKQLHVRDVASWRPLTQELSCDRYAVYFCNRRVRGADPRTIWLLPPAGQSYFRDHAAFYCNDFVISGKDYYERFWKEIGHFEKLVNLFEEGYYFSKMFRRCVPMDVEISDEGRRP